jgi:hypothetical protein
MATKKEIIEQVQALISAEVSESTLSNVVALLQEMGKRGTAGGRSKDIIINDIEYRWCNRHGQYEPLEWFLIENDGKYKPECAAAYYKWQAYGKEINKALKAEDYAKIGELTVLRKKGGYDLTKDTKEFADKLAEEGIAINPKEAIAEEDVK